MARLLADAQNSPDREICGLLFGTLTRIESIRACANVARDPGRPFEIEPAALLAAHREARAGGPVMIGHYHSHPVGEATPSRRDAAQAAGDGALWLILAARRARAWRSTRPGHFEAVPLVVDPA